MQNEVLRLKLAGFAIETVEVDECQADIEAHSLARQATCPCCGQIAKRVHSWYERHPQDLPWCGIRIRLHLSVQKFFCDNPDCLRKIFVERLPKLVPVHAQKTSRLRETMRLLAFGLGGELGARLLARLGITTSPDTLLRLIRLASTIHDETPRVLGVDDWAYRRGHIYGTILCDLEKRCVVDLLPDREAETLAQWLKTHPGIEIVSRDRAGAYIEGISSGAPQAIQVADRWHLLKNLRESVQKQLEQFQQRFEWAVELSQGAAVSTILESEALAEKRLKHRDEHFERYQKVIGLLKVGYSQAQVATMLGISIRTVNRYWNAPDYPERKRRKLSSSLIDPFQDYIHERWEAGCDNAKQLWRELCKQGFEGSYDSVARALARLRKGFPLRREAETERAKAQKKSMSSQEISWLFILDAARLDPKQAQDLERVLQDYPETQLLKQLAREFVEIFQKRTVEAFKLWMQKVDESSFAVLQSFVKGLRKDEAAIVAALTLEWSNGPVEGQVNRLKLIKRQMYGRANFDLLRQRVVMCL